MAKNTTEEGLAEWKNSNGKKFLRKELWDISSCYHGMSIKEIHSSDDRFSVYPLKNFTTNFKNLKKKVVRLRAQVDFDERALSQHMTSYPQSSHTKRDYPHWNDHSAKQHFEDNVHNGIEDTMLPSELRMTWQSYQDFPPDIFCVRVHAKKRKHREQTFLVAKQNKTVMERHLKEAAEMRKNRK